MAIAAMLVVAFPAHAQPRAEGLGDEIARVPSQPELSSSGTRIAV